MSCSDSKFKQVMPHVGIHKVDHENSEVGLRVLTRGKMLLRCVCPLDLCWWVSYTHDSIFV